MQLVVAPEYPFFLNQVLPRDGVALKQPIRIKGFS